MFKRIKIILLIFTFINSMLLLNSCIINKTNDIDKNNEKIKTTYFYSNYIYDDIIKSYGMLFNSNYLGNSLNAIIIPNDMIVGDILKIDYIGELIATESYPGTLHIAGELIGYEVIKSEIKEIKNNDIEKLKEQYLIYNEYVIINSTLDFVSLSNYDGEVIYYTTYDLLNNEDYEKNIVTCMYAYNPRNN